MSTEKIPLVSVIIPMYNSAKFISQTLESLLYQTMKDFEVVVVDDCSTDNSIEVVESFIPRFNAEGGSVLNIIKLPKNSGISSTPRNIGIQIARGKYIAFLDSDDLYTKTALEELTTLAEEYKADIVHMHHFFNLWDGKAKSAEDPAFTDMAELTNPANFTKARNPRHTPDKPTFDTNDLKERVNKFVMGVYAGQPYASFYRRDFLIVNQITFPDVYICHDQIFTFHAMCLAEKILHVPNVNYIVRPRTGSIMREQSNFIERLHRDMRTYIDGFNALNKIMDGIKFFNDYPDHRCVILDGYVRDKLRYFVNHHNTYRKNLSHHELHNLIEKEFQSGGTAFAAYIFDMLNVLKSKA